METNIQVLNENTDVEELPASFEMLTLLSGNSRQKQSNPLNGKSDLNFVTNKEMTDGDNIKKNLLLKLKQINISDCKLTEIPSAIFHLKYLTDLNLSNNLLESLPKEVANLHNLITLHLNGNKLSYLPKSLKSSQQLNYLDLSCNNFSEVPVVLYYGLRALKVLNLSCNMLREFNDSPACLNKLIVLGLSNNSLSQVPLWIFDNLCQLQVLDISENPLSLGVDLDTYCSGGIFESLHLLNIGNCNFNCDNIEVFSHCSSVRELHCGNRKYSTAGACGRNYFGNLNVEAFRNFKEIKDLYLQNVDISTLPSDFSYFHNIELLDLSNNSLSWLPESFCTMSTLKILKLTSNQLLYLPNTIGNLVNLQQIHVSDNKLYQIPDSFYNLNNLQFIDFYNNEINKINPSIFKGKNLKGIDLGLNFLQFSFDESGVDVVEVGMLYNCLKDSFRKHFDCSDFRSDSQKLSADDKGSLKSQVSIYSSSSLESEKMSDLDDSFTHGGQQCNTEDESWEVEDSCADEADDSFDPNGEYSGENIKQKLFSLGADVSHAYFPLTQIGTDFNHGANPGVATFETITAPPSIMCRP